MKKLSVLFLFSFMLFQCSSKKGCIDPGSLSYDPEAKIDDGSCTYPFFSAPPVLVRSLDNVFIENSGLQFLNDRIWTITDKAGSNLIMSIDTVSGGIREEIKIKNASSVNNEAIATSDQHFYIGDIGNNDGNREDLVIYKFPIPNLIMSNNTVISESIQFYYPEQNDFRENSLTNFDCEAMFYHNGYIYLFTKNNQGRKTNLYEIPAIPGRHTAKLKGIFDTNGLITDADISDDGLKIVLTGYNPVNNKIFLWIFSGYQENQFFSGKKVLWELGSKNTLGQVEGVTFYNNDNNNIFISSERYLFIPPKLYRLNIYQAN